MSFDTALRMVLAKDETARYKVMDTRRKDFIWTDELEDFQAWNKQARARGIGEARLEYADDDQVFLRYGSQRTPLACGNDGNNDILAIHTLNMLAKHLLEIRYCHDTTGNSDVAFLAMPPDEWQSLEEQYGKAAIYAIFYTLTDSIKALQLAMAGEHEAWYGGGEAPTGSPYEALLRDLPDTWEAEAERWSLTQCDPALLLPAVEGLVSARLQERNVHLHRSTGVFVMTTLHGRAEIAPLLTQATGQGYVVVFDETHRAVFKVTADAKLLVWPPLDNAR